MEEALKYSSGHRHGISWLSFYCQEPTPFSAQTHTRTHTLCLSRSPAPNKTSLWLGACVYCVRYVLSLVLAQEHGSAKRNHTEEALWVIATLSWQSCMPGPGQGGQNQMMVILGGEGMRRGRQETLHHAEVVVHGASRRGLGGDVDCAFNNCVLGWHGGNEAVVGVRSTRIARMRMRARDGGNGRVVRGDGGSFV